MNQRDILIIILCCAVLAFGILCDCLKASIDAEKAERRELIWRTTRGQTESFQKYIRSL